MFWNLLVTSWRSEGTAATATMPSTTTTPITLPTTPPLLGRLGLFDRFDTPSDLGVLGAWYEEPPGPDARLMAVGGRGPLGVETPGTFGVETLLGGGPAESRGDFGAVGPPAACGVAGPVGAAALLRPVAGTVEGGRRRNIRCHQGRRTAGVATASSAAPHRLQKRRSAVLASPHEPQ